jgi:hypothetical protein
LKDKKLQEQESLINELKQYHGTSSSGNASNLQIRQLQEEITRLRQLNKNRDDILNEIDTKNQSLRETETKLKLTQNDYEVLENKNK